MARTKLTARITTGGASSSSCSSIHGQSDARTGKPPRKQVATKSTGAKKTVHTVRLRLRFVQQLICHAM